MTRTTNVLLTLSCSDKVGVVAAVAQYVAERGGWIADSSSHSDNETGRFFLRLELRLPSGADKNSFFDSFGNVALRLDMYWTVRELSERKAVAIFVGTEEHCLYDLLSRHRAGQLGADIRCVISNHDALGDIARWHGIDFYHVPIRKEFATEGWAETQRLLDSHDIEVVVLARYMQVIPKDMCDRYSGRMINIHHSFLPSFAGARAYHQAHERGVKLIGATCHYVTADLDEGPIIEQDVVRIDHSDSVEELRRAGKDIEKAVLARALRWHLEDRVFVNGSKTVVFR